MEVNKIIERKSGITRRYCNGLDINIETREVEGSETSETIIKGYALKFEQKSRLLNDCFYEIIDKDALRSADMTETRCLFNHDKNFILGRVSADTLTLRVDSVGLYYEAVLPNTSYAKDLKESIDRRDITGSSFAFSYTLDEWRDNEDGTYERRVKEISFLYDVSPVTFPAYDQSEVRSCPESLEEYIALHNWRDDYNARKAIIDNF